MAEFCSNSATDGARLLHYTSSNRTQHHGRYDHRPHNTNASTQPLVKRDTRPDQPDIITTPNHGVTPCVSTSTPRS